MRSLDFTACVKQDECPFDCERKLTKEEKEWLARNPNRMSYADFSEECKKEVSMRYLDGIYFRVNRDGKWQNICFSDLTTDEEREVLSDKSKDYLIQLAINLAGCLKEIGNQLDIEGVNNEQGE